MFLKYIHRLEEIEINENTADEYSDDDSEDDGIMIIYVDKKQECLICHQEYNIYIQHRQKNGNI